MGRRVVNSYQTGVADRRSAATLVDGDGGFKRYKQPSLATAWLIMTQQSHAERQQYGAGASS